MVDDVGQVLAEAAEQFVARQPALRRQIVDLIERMDTDWMIYATTEDIAEIEALLKGLKS